MPQLVSQHFSDRFRRAVILLRELISTDFKLRYQGSFLGYLWSLLKPLGLFLILYTVFVKVFNFGKDIEHYPIYLLLGIVLWNYFLEVTLNGMSAILARGDLIRKINFPKYVIVLSGSFIALINLIFNLIVVAFFMIINNVDIHREILLLPLILAELFVLGLAAAFFLSAAYVKYRDLGPIWEIFMQGLFYATPVLYPVSMMKAYSEEAAKLLMLNPIAQIIQDARYVTVNKTQTETVWSLHAGWAQFVPLLLTALLLVVAYTYFRTRSKYFAEQI